MTNKGINSKLLVAIVFFNFYGIYPFSYKMDQNKSFQMK